MSTAAEGRELKYDLQPERQPMIAWMKSKGFIPFDYCLWGIAWSQRSGYDFTDLEFYPLERHDGDIGWDAIVGHHASGTNPRLIFGTCETLEEMQECYDLLRRLNGYPGPEPEIVVP